MKKISIMLVLVAMITSSCEDFLNTVPDDKIGAEQYYADEKGITAGLFGVYDVLQSFYGTTMYKHLEVCTDEGYYNENNTNGKQGVKAYFFDSTDPNVTGLWNNLYTGIQRANDVIAHINSPSMDEANRQVVLGEALFLRGYFYFMLVSRWGDVPLRLEPTTSPIKIDKARTPAAEVYAQILKDLKEAEVKVREKKWNHASRVSKTVVQGFIARVYLQMAGYPLMDTDKYKDALVYSQKVIDSQERALTVTYRDDPKYTDVYTPASSTAPVPAPYPNNAYRQIFINVAEGTYDTNESMWECEFGGNGIDGWSEQGGIGCQNGIGYGNAKFGYSYGYVKATGRLYKIYGQGDLRRDWAMNTFTYADVKGVTFKRPLANPNQPYDRFVSKWRREFEVTSPRPQESTSINFSILRYADVLLMNAEAENQVNGPTTKAYDAVNQVRRRGYGLPIDASNSVADLTPGLDKAGFQRAIQDERMRELCFELTRRSDLIRWYGLDFPAYMNSIGKEISENTENTGVRFGGVGGMNVTQRHLLYPIPSIEMFTNALAKQNPGW